MDWNSWISVLQIASQNVIWSQKYNLLTNAHGPGELLGEHVRRGGGSWRHHELIYST